MRLTNDDPLSTRIECGFERSGDFTLRDLLAFAVGGQSKCQLERLGEQRWRKPQGRGAPSHHRPFLSCGLLNVAADEGAQARFRFARKSSGKDHDGSERARFTIDRRIGPFVVVPDLRRSERDKKAEDNAQCREHSGGNCLECTRSLALREGRDEPAIPAASKYVKPKTISAIQPIGRLCSQSAMLRGPLVNRRKSDR